jgi:hypothetical protein
MRGWEADGCRVLRQPLMSFGDERRRRVISELVVSFVEALLAVYCFSLLGSNISG